MVSSMLKVKVLEVWFWPNFDLVRIIFIFLHYIFDHDQPFALRSFWWVISQSYNGVKVNVWKMILQAYTLGQLCLFCLFNVVH